MQKRSYDAPPLLLLLCGKSLVHGVNLVAETKEIENFREKLFVHSFDCRTPNWIICGASTNVAFVTLYTRYTVVSLLLLLCIVISLLNATWISSVTHTNTQTVTVNDTLAPGRREKKLQKENNNAKGEMFKLLKERDFRRALTMLWRQQCFTWTNQHRLIVCCLRVLLFLPTCVRFFYSLGFSETREHRMRRE